MPHCPPKPTLNTGPNPVGCQGGCQDGCRQWAEPNALKATCPHFGKGSVCSHSRAASSASKNKLFASSSSWEHAAHFEAPQRSACIRAATGARRCVGAPSRETSIPPRPSGTWPTGRERRSPWRLLGSCESCHLFRNDGVPLPLLHTNCSFPYLSRYGSEWRFWHSSGPGHRLCGA